MALVDIIQAFLLAFFAIFSMEMGDKTQLTAFTLGIRYRSPLKVFIGVITGLAGVTIIAVFLGLVLKETIDFQHLKPLISILFIFGGIFILYIEMRDSKNNEMRICPVSLDLCDNPREGCSEMDNCDHYLDATVRKGALFRSAVLMFGAELGDKTMLMGVGLATQFDPIGVFIGAIMALSLVNGVGVFFGDKIAKKIPRKTIGIISGLLFILTGILILFV